MSDAEQIFRDTLHTVAKNNDIHNYELTIKPISTGGANYSSHLFLAKISGSEEINVFGKVAAFGEKWREQTPIKMYDCERYFYLVLSKVYREIEEKNKLAVEERLKVPKFYGCNPNIYEETIVLEDLGSKGFTTHDRMKSFDWDYASAAVSQLAKFHALSIVYQRENKEAYVEEVKLLEADWEKHTSDWETVIEGFLRPALEAVSEEHKDKLKRHLQTFNNKTFKSLSAAMKVEVIIHGDFRPSNLMHRTLEDGSLEVVPVDFQTLRGGSPIVDLLYFIYTGSDEEFRRLHFQELVDHYYSELSRAMTRLGIEPDTYTKKDFDEELKEKLPFGLFVGICLLPLVTVEAENAPKMNADMDISSFSIKKAGQLYPERFNGIIKDYIRWGILT